MDSLISKNEVLSIIANMQIELHYNGGKYAERFAVEQLNEVLKKIESLPSVNNWISCKDKLPNLSGQYLATGVEYNLLSDELEDFYRILRYYPKLKKWNTKATMKVTHWQTLPELPEI